MAGNRDDDNSERAPLLKAASSQGASLTQHTGSLLSNWWLWELLETCISTIALVVIVIILFVYDGSSLPDWPSVFTVRRYFPVELLPSLMILHR